MEHRFILEPYKNLSSRKVCPACGKKEFTLYIDKETNEPINLNVGRCNRENNCNYHLAPKQYYNENNITEVLPITSAKPIQSKSKEVSYIDTDIFKNSLKNYENNNFIQFLISKFGKSTTIDLIKKYYIGTSKHWNGATVFYQMDINSKIKAGKIMLYNATTGKRIKEQFDHITWLHSLLKLDDFSLSQCLFGEHLIIDKTKTIAIVESEKTAIICSIYLPDFIWLATGGKQNIRPDLFRDLHNRKIVFYPDLGAFETWSEKVKTLGLKNYSISDLLENKASEEEKVKGLDIADYLLKNEVPNSNINDLIKLQFSKLTKECWILNKDQDFQLTNYNLNVLCDSLNLTHKINITPEVYYNTYLSMN